MSDRWYEVEAIDQDGRVLMDGEDEDSETPEDAASNMIEAVRHQRPDALPCVREISVTPVGATVYFDVWDGKVAGKRS